MVKFDVTKEQYAIISKISGRADEKFRFDRLSVEMDICATIAQGQSLDLAKLLAFDDFNFVHDVGGIADHIDRKTGKLEGFFLPRCAI